MRKILIFILMGCGDSANTTEFITENDSIFSPTTSSSSYCECEDDDLSCTNCYKNRIVFVHTMFDFNKDFDLQCEELAKENILLDGKKWKVWYSTSNFNAIDRIDHSEGKFVQVNGKEIAVGWKNLINGKLMNNIDTDHLGNDGLILDIATGTNFNGEIFTNYTCGNWTNIDSEGFFGSTEFSNERWTINKIQSCNNITAIYCFESFLE